MQQGIFVVRHGEYSGKNLTDKGRKTAENSAKDLLCKGLGSRAIVLASMAERAMETAGIISTVLEGRAPLRSERLFLIGNNPDLIKGSLRVELDSCLNEHSLSLEDATERGLVVVAQMPLVSEILHGNQFEPSAYGAVAQYA